MWSFVCYMYKYSISIADISVGTVTAMFFIYMKLLCTHQWAKWCVLVKFNHDFSWRTADYKHHISVIFIKVLLLLCQLLSLQLTFFTCTLIFVGMIVFIDITTSHTHTHTHTHICMYACTLTHTHTVMWSKYLSRFIFVCGIIIIWILYWWSNTVMLL